MWKAEHALATRPGAASPPPPPPATWSVTACLTYRGGLEIRAAAENILPGWGHGGERLSFLLHLRRRLRLAVTSQCSAPAPAEQGKKPRGLKILRFLRNKLARAPLVPSALRRKKPPPPPSAAVAKSGPRTPAIPSLLDRALTRPAWTTALCFVAALAVVLASVAALRFMVGLMIPNMSCTSWRCFLAKKFVKFLGPPLFERLSKISLKFLDPPLCEWLGLPKLTLKWLFNR